ncbi:7514_t:CDS:2 [Racocetra fulgida]|uniref:7514_t:CDS:1 n=1 Tax=Racocetra fulgida TaxID=60492 RepID=A0A9N9F458_9GLOM|nr:7514_t:CDS:2 [Racocetra fulgida]
MRLNLLFVAFTFGILIGSVTATNGDNRQLFKRQQSKICANGQCADSDKRPFNASCLVDNACAGDFCRTFADGRRGCTRTSGEKCNADEECPGSVCSQNSTTCVDADNRAPGQRCIYLAACASGRCDFTSGKGICAQNNGGQCNNDTDYTDNRKGGDPCELRKCTLSNGEKCKDDNDCVSLVYGQKTQVCQDDDDRKGGDPCETFMACKNRACHKPIGGRWTCPLRPNYGQRCGYDSDCDYSVCGQTTHKCRYNDNRDVGSFCESPNACKSGNCDNIRVRRGKCAPPIEFL